MTAPKPAPDTTLLTAIAERTADPTNTLAKLIERKHEVQVLTLEDPRFEGARVPVASVPEGRELQDLTELLDEYLPHPVRRKGTAKLLTTAAFLKHVERFQHEAETALFAVPSPTDPTVTAIYDYHASPRAVDGQTAPVVPGWCEHRAVLSLRLSNEWKAWWAVNDKPLTQTEFASFLQDRMADLTLVDAQEPDVVATRELLDARIGGPQSMMTLSRGLEVRQNITVKDARTLETGEVQIAYVETQEAAGGGPLTSPTLFFITIPIFYGGGMFRVPVRVRYRITPQGIRWSLLLFRADKAFDVAFKAVIDEVSKVTGLPVFIGAPEA